jgi:hypothetical protein
MHLRHAPLSLAILVATASLLTAAPPGDGGLTSPPRLAQAGSNQPAPPEDLPTRPQSGQKVGLDRDAAALAQSPEKGGNDAATKGKGCGKPGCTSCIPQVATCKAKWEDKKTKKAKFTQKCDFECARPWEPYHQGACCEEKTTPCGDVRTKKKLFKTEEEKVERVLKYEVVMKPAAPCCEPEPVCGCLGCRCLGSAFERVFSWCH